MIVNVRSQAIEIVFVDGLIRDDGIELLGLCDAPGTRNRRIRLSKQMDPERQLEVLIHELLHACFWDLREDAVDESADDIARILTQFGYQQKNGDQEKPTNEMADSRVRTLGFAATSQSKRV